MGEMDEQEFQYYEDLVFGLDDMVLDHWPSRFGDYSPIAQLRDSDGNRVSGCYRSIPHLSE